MRVQLELRHLRAFVVVAEELHFTRAARRLHVAQQALSAQIRQLEDELGTRVFTRTTRNVELTDAGRTLLAHAVPILEAVSTAWEETTRVSRGETDQLAICYAPTAGRETLPLLVEEFHARYPNVHVRTLVMWQAEAVDAVTAGRFDIGLSRCPTGLGRELECVPIRHQQLGVVLASEHRLAGEDPVPLSALSGDSLAIWPREFSPGYHDWVIDALRARGFSGPLLEFENVGLGMLLTDAATRTEVVACRAFGIGYAQQYTPLPAGLLWRTTEPALLVPMHMIWKRSARPAVHNFAAHAQNVARRKQWLDPASTEADRTAQPITPAAQ